MTNVIEPVSVAELNLPLAVPEVDAWVTSLCTRYRRTVELERYFLEKRGLSNDIQKELIPLAKLCKRIASERPTSRLLYFHGSAQSFDAQILSESGCIEEVLEVTLACDGYQEAVAAEALSIYGWAPLWSPVQKSGARPNRVIPEPEIQSLDANTIVDECLNQVRMSVERKSDSGKYRGVSLVVGIDDFRLLTQQQIDRALKSFMAINSCFNAIYFVGLGERVFLCSRNKA